MKMRRMKLLRSRQRRIERCSRGVFGVHRVGSGGGGISGERMLARAIFALGCWGWTSCRARSFIVQLIKAFILMAWWRLLDTKCQLRCAWSVTNVSYDGWELLLEEKQKQRKFCMNDKKKEVRGSNKAVSMRDLAVCPLTVCDVRFRSPMVLSGDNPYLMFPWLSIANREFGQTKAYTFTPGSAKETIRKVGRGVVQNG